MKDKLDTLERIGRGFTADVYAIEPGRVIKLFHDWVSPDRVEREFRLTCALFEARLPVPKAYVLQEMEGRRGIIFERVTGISMLGWVQTRPARLFRAVRQLAELHYQIHSFASPIELPSLRSRIAQGIDAAPGLTLQEKETAHQQLAQLPDGNAICHGDFHPGNILYTDHGPVVIDWGSATRGDALGDVACTSRLLQTASLPPWSPRYMHLVLKCTRALLHHYYLKRYFELRPGSRCQVDAWKAPLAAAARSWRPRRS